MNKTLLSAMLCVALASGALAGCAEQESTQPEDATEATVAVAQDDTATEAEDNAEDESSDATESSSKEEAAGTESTAEKAADNQKGSTFEASLATVNAAENGLVNATELFTERDLTQGADTSSATAYTVEDGKDIEITEEGVYVISGTAKDATITVNAEDSAKVQLVLDNLSITNEGEAAIYVKSADKVFVTLAAGSTNTLTTTGEFAADGDTNVDGVVFAKDDIVFNGTGTLVVNSSANGLVGKDDLKVTGGTYEITAGNHAIQGKDSVAIADGTFTLKADKDGIHAENSDDTTKGYAYIGGGTFTITAASDGIEGDAFVQVDGGTITIDGAEGIEGTYVQMNGGDVSINASDDGINATQKATAYDTPTIEINDGKLAITMGAGDTDALDANGNLYINGGTVDITAQFAFDFDGEGQLKGGTVTVNGEQVTTIESSMMGGHGMGGGRHGGMGGGMGGPRGDMGGGFADQQDDMETSTDSAEGTNGDTSDDSDQGMWIDADDSSWDENDEDLWGDSDDGSWFDEDDLQDDIASSPRSEA